MLSRPQFPWVALLVIAAAIFVSVTSEFLPTGLLPDIAAEFDVSESKVGFLVTLFAGTVVLTAAPLSILTRRLSRKSLVIAVMLLFLVANVAAGLAPTYELLAAARVLGGLAHGLFWAVMGAYAAHLVPKKQLGRAVAITGSGATAAFILGVPLGTALGHAVGWRLAFISVAGIVLVLILLVARYLPAVERHAEPPLRTGEIRVPARRDPTVPVMVVICVVILVVITGHNLFFTYVAPWLTAVAGVPAGGVAGVLFLYGGAGAIGLISSGLVADRFPRAALPAALALIGAVVSLLAVVSSSTPLAITAIALWGAAFGGVPAMFQTRMLHDVSPRLRDLASALITTAFNIGIGGGALAGGILLDRVGIWALPWFDVVLVGVGFVILVIAGIVRERRRPAVA
jgi:predicted MFS family arabinose efflux permease